VIYPTLTVFDLRFLPLGGNAAKWSRRKFKSIGGLVGSGVSGGMRDVSFSNVEILPFDVRRKFIKLV
jgi:hypothetical protein